MASIRSAIDEVHRRQAVREQLRKGPSPFRNRIIGMHTVSGLKSGRIKALSGVYDVAIIGGGIVGLSLARQILLNYPHISLIVLEKENFAAQHQTARNSGVIHAGIYYRPGSQRAVLCTRGSELMYDFCKEKSIETWRCGKLIVASHENELDRLHKLLDNAKANGVPGVQLLTGDQAREVCES